MNKRYANPYVIGVCLGLVLLFSFCTMGPGVGSSASFARIGTFGMGLVALVNAPLPLKEEQAATFQQKTAPVEKPRNAPGFKIVEDEGC